MFKRERCSLQEILSLDINMFPLKLEIRNEAKYYHPEYARFNEITILSNIIDYNTRLVIITRYGELSHIDLENINKYKSPTQVEFTTMTPAISDLVLSVDELTDMDMSDFPLVLTRKECLLPRYNTITLLTNIIIDNEIPCLDGFSCQSSIRVDELKEFRIKF